MNSSPGEKVQDYGTLYHNFAETYESTHQLTQQFYPTTKRFISTLEPEIDKVLKHMNQINSGGPYAIQSIMHYINKFDDFILVANKQFGIMRDVLGKSEAIINKVTTTKTDIENDGKNIEPEFYKSLAPEISELMEMLKMVPERTTELQANMKKLEDNWAKTKVKLQGRK